MEGGCKYLFYSRKIDAALWIGFTGSNGISALGDILKGDVNPSGRLVDTWAADFTKNPAFINFGTGCLPDSTDKYDGGMYYSVDYEEGIYVGYRYYETRGFTDGEEWYKANVVFPFGYGLSYTDFEWTVGEPSATEIEAGTAITVPVTVKNTGKTAGKDVVELYASAPYTEGGIEKAYKVLVGFAKTSLLQPGASETVTLSFDPYAAASYDYRDANGNGFNGYELEYRPGRAGHHLGRAGLRPPFLLQQKAKGQVRPGINPMLRRSRPSLISIRKKGGTASERKNTA